MGIIIAIFVFGLIIAIHEFGHFIAAKTSGVRVNEFAIGMGPAILKKQKGETLYSLRILPIGGYCALEGEDKTSEDDCALNNKSIGKRLKIMAAGAFMNLVLGIVVVFILTIMSSYIVVPVIFAFSDDSPSESAGLEAGDKLVEVDGINIYSTLDLSYALSSVKTDTYDVKVKRNGEKIEYKDIQLSGLSITRQEKTVLNVVSTSLKESFSIGRIVWISLGDLITGNFSMDDLSGPIGVVSVIDQTVSSENNESFKETAMNLLNLVAFITINIGIFNLLPLPALDGGRIMFLIIEAIRGKPVKPDHEGIVHFIGIVVLLGFMVIISFNDILRLIGG